jgi:hypothetical protein
LGRDDNSYHRKAAYQSLVEGAVGTGADRDGGWHPARWALTPTNLVGNAVATIAIAKWERAVDENRLKRVLDGDASLAVP